MPPSCPVLVVEDDPSIRAMLTMALEDEGYEVRAVEDGRPALDLLEYWRPQVILLDLMMPGVDGLAFRDRQLAREDLAGIPVIVLSAGLTPPARLDKLRAAAFFAKPFDPEQLLATVQNLIQARLESPPRPGLVEHTR